MVDELLRVVVEHGIWGVVTLLVVLAARSRPARVISRVISAEIKWRYLRAKGLSESKLRKQLLKDWDDRGDDQPPKPALDPPSPDG